VKAVVTVVAGVAILAVGFMVYRWQRNDDGERRRAEKAAEQGAAFCRKQGSRCDVVRVEPLSEGFWRLHVRNPGQATKCWRLDLEGFRATERDSVYVGGAIEGISDMACTETLWTAQDAAARLADSGWAKGRKASFISFAGIGKNLYAAFTDRFNCRYSVGRRDRYVVIRTTGADTFAIDGR
jgi:hypothetical protein